MGRLWVILAKTSVLKKRLDNYDNEEGINDNGGWGGYDMATYRTGWDIASRHGNH
jgi:hypothetical protein